MESYLITIENKDGLKVEFEYFASCYTAAMAHAEYTIFHHAQLKDYVDYIKIKKLT